MDALVDLDVVVAVIVIVIVIGRVSAHGDDHARL